MVETNHDNIAKTQTKQLSKIDPVKSIFKRATIKSYKMWH